MRWVVLGSGSLGSTFAGMLDIAGHDVTLVARRHAYVDAIAQRGLVLRAPDGSERVAHPAVTATPSDLEAADVVIVLTKSFSNREAAASIAHAVHEGTWVITPQNGLGNDRVLAEALPTATIVPGSTTVGAVLEEPGVVSLTPATDAGDTDTTLGPPNGLTEVPQQLEDITRQLTEAGLPAQATPDAALVAWTKLAAAAPMNVLSAVLQQRVAMVLGDPDAYQLACEGFEEVVRVGQTIGVALDHDRTWDYTHHAWSSAGEHVPSMLRDVLEQQQTEVDSQCLEVVRLAEEHGIDVPVLRVLGALLSAMQRGYETTGQ